MAAYVRMRKPDGTSVEVHPDDVGKAVASGWKAGAAPADTSGYASMRAEIAKGERGLSTGLRDFIPTAAATGAAMMIPGGELSIPFIPRLLLAAQRIGAAGAGGMGGEMIRRGIEREPMEPRAIVREGGRQMAFATPGEGLAQIGESVAYPLARYAWRMSPTAQKAAGANMTATARQMYPEGEKLWVSALRERVPPDVGAIKGAAGKEAAKKGRLLRADVAKGNTYTAFDVIREAGVPEIRAELAMRKNAKPALDELDERIKTFVAQRRHGGKGSQIGPLRRYNAEELQNEIRVWQKENENLYKKAERSGEVPMTEAFDTALPRGANRAIQRNEPRLAPVNARLQRLGRLEEEAANVNRKGSIFLPLIAGGGGALTGDDPAERAKNALVTAALVRGALAPGIQGRAALALTNRGVQRALREAPRWMLPWLYPNDQPAMPERDTTR